LQAIEPQPPAEMSLADGLAYATRLHREGQLDAAETIYRRVLDVAPDHADALHFLGVLIHQRGDRDTAIELIRRSIAIDPALADRYVNLGNVLAEWGELDEAAANYRQAISCAHAAAAVLANAWSNLGAARRNQERYEAAAAAYEKAIEFAPGHADAYNNYGNLLLIQGHVKEAVGCYCKAITIAPRNPQTRPLLGLAYYRLGQLDDAAMVYRAWLADEPDNPVALHMFAACSGENVPERASDAYVETTFDNFAESFDAKLHRLDYRAPQLVAETVVRIVGGGQIRHILDAGCGTGLCGPLLKPYSARITGVDLSGGMLERARTRGVYDELVKGELSAYLAANPMAYDLVVSADTLVYFGSLDSVLRAAREALLPGGILAFTLEAMSSEGSTADYRINPHGRYSHRRDYVHRLLMSVGYSQISMEEAVLRKEGGVPVAGFVVSCRKASEGGGCKGG